MEKHEITTEFFHFCYNFPHDIRDRLIELYGKRMGQHFYRKYRGYALDYKGMPWRTFHAMVRMYCEMTDGNRKIFHQLVDEYNQEMAQH